MEESATSPLLIGNIALTLSGGDNRREVQKTYRAGSVRIDIENPDQLLNQEDEEIKDHYSEGNVVKVVKNHKRSNSEEQERQAHLVQTWRAGQQFNLRSNLSSNHKNSDDTGLETSVENRNPLIPKSEELLDDFDENFVDRVADPVEEGQGILCEVCYCEYNADDLFSLKCKHTFCVNCQADHLRTKITNGQAMKLPCM